MSKIKNLILLSVLLSGFMSFASAQDSTNHVLFSYYPLHIGDRWQYETKYYSVGPYPEVRYNVREVLGDTLMPNGFKYFIVDDNVGSPSPAGISYQRIDSVNYEIKYYTYGFTDSTDLSIYPLFYRDTSFTWYDYAGIPFEVVYTDTIDRYLQLERDYLAWINIYFSKDLGIIYDTYNEAGGMSVTHLIWAEIDGKQWGEFLSIENSDEIIAAFDLLDSYPNPFNSSQTIEFTLKKNSKISLEIYSVDGRLVCHLAEGEYKAGKYTFKWNAAAVSTGLYIIRLSIDNRIITKKSILIK